MREGFHLQLEDGISIDESVLIERMSYCGEPIHLQTGRLRSFDVLRLHVQEISE
jgi:hypothetical protein